MVKFVSLSALTFFTVAAMSAVNLKFFTPVCRLKKSLKVELKANLQRMRLEWRLKGSVCGKEDELALMPGDFALTVESGKIFSPIK